MKTRSLILVLIFCLGLIPAYPAQAQGETPRSFFDSLAMLYVSDAILSGYTELEEASHVSHLMAPALDSAQDTPDNAALAAALQAAKDQRDDLDTNCALMISQHRKVGEDCEADRFQESCAQQKAEINAEIGRLHKLRGDRRRGLTRVWHSIKRGGRSVWHRIGPVGRNFLRQVGPETLKIVASGGTLNTSVLKALFKNTAKDMLRDRLEKMTFQGVQHLFNGQLELARAAGLDICDPESEVTGAEDPEEGAASPEEFMSFILTTKEVDFFWNSLLEPEDEFHSCGSLWPDEDEAFSPIDFELGIDVKNKTITGEFQGSRKIENLSNGTTGYVDSLQNQSFTARLDGPFKVDELTEGIVLTFTGTTKLTLTLDGERECHYWTNPANGSPELVKYWINRIESVTIDYPYEVRIYTEDGMTGKLTLRIGGNAKPWAEASGFWIKTEDFELTEDEIGALWNK